MSKIIEFREHLKRQIPEIDKYLQETAKSKFFIEDNINCSKIVYDPIEEDRLFCVNNKNNQNICLIPIDGKEGLLGFGTTNCDVVIFGAEHFRFIEFKLNATSTKERAIEKNRKKAVEQLGNTIRQFDKLLEKDYKGLVLEAYIATPPTYPRASASSQQHAVEFLEEHQIPLFEKSKIDL